MFTSKFNSVLSSPNERDFTARDPKRCGTFFTPDIIEKFSTQAAIPQISAPTLNYHSKPFIPLPARPTLPMGKTTAPTDFSTMQLPPQSQMDIAMGCRVLDSRGNSFEFSQLIDRKCRTVVIFIRNFRCAFCQAYIKHLSTIANEREEYGVIKSAGIKVVIIGLGSHYMIQKYGALFPCPYPIYTDASESNRLYRALGMNKRSIESGPDLLKGDYLESMSTLELLTYGIKNSLKLPGLKSPGDLKQLGGELIFEPVPTFKAARIPVKVKALELKALTGIPSITLNVPKPSTPNAQVSLSLDRSSIYVPSGGLGPFLNLKPTSPMVSIHCRFAHRMSFTRDHLSLYDLFGRAGIRLESNPKKTLSWI
ncbi:uncharacterized protein MELLADRAFT_117548 [Melampsora larici-populina 98AG31]|uniref:Uncharacterized protein n=1 Tax=Melampsora larici-populina (strain 98AG31 / pathotype 3-4-7) TaxID=747676 RepID=F4RYN2_MELLP|nr:uncharacterized protein MELLADRAFT_117548 [Melampsora larici-populina 98AG31]EGG02499.1 hypothetical protein MELLADRAFT_117548 [Melampsora larici-populina 98AG31]